MCVWRVCMCGPKLSFTKEVCRSLKFCSELSLSVPTRKKEKGELSEGKMQESHTY